MQIYPTKQSTELSFSDMFAPGEYYPAPEHEERIRRYKENKKLFLGKHYEVLQRYSDRLSPSQKKSLYISINLPGVICKKSADFLFGESALYSAGKEDDSPEQKALERIAEENDLHILNYESALSNAYRGDSFYKIRYGQEFDGQLPANIDKPRVIIEAQNPEFVFPETAPGDQNRVIAYHIAYPVQNDLSNDQDWTLHVESHYPGRIEYAQFRMTPLVTTVDGEVKQWTIQAEIEGTRQTVNTGVPFPLIVHVPNYATDDSWEGIDDLSEHIPIFDELNNRITMIAEILDKHADPALVVPAGSLQEDEYGNPTFRVGVDKVFEVMDKNEVSPFYVTWDGQLAHCFQEIERLTNLVLTNAEIPIVSLGAGDSGTSGASGLAIKWRMNSLLAKINRKRQYYEKALKRVFLIAQLLEQAVSKTDYEITIPKIKFRDGLPKDDLEQANIMSIRTAGAKTISQKTALMLLDGLTEEQAEKELERIRNEEAIVDPSIFNEPGKALTNLPGKQPGEPTPGTEREGE
jgi:SPP1 family phage portal protein